VEALYRRGDKVRILDNLSTGNLANLAQVRHATEFITGDVADRARACAALNGVEVVFHLAVPSAPCNPAFPPVLNWLYDPTLVHVLIASRQAKVRRLIYASSGSVYGRCRSPCVRENDPPLPVTADGLAKLAGEHHCLGFTALYGLETVRLRYFDTFGPRQHPSSPHAQVLTTIVQELRAGRAPVLDEECFARRDFVDVDDVVQATIAAAEAPRVSGNVYNIARGRSVSALEIVSAVNEILGTRVVPLARDWRYRDSPRRSVDISRAEADLGFCPAIDLRAGLRRLVDYYEQAENRSTPSPLVVAQPNYC
jgi:UDP-glucose 4-epimerase